MWSRYAVQRLPASIQLINGRSIVTSPSPHIFRSTGLLRSSDDKRTSRSTWHGTLQQRDKRKYCSRRLELPKQYKSLFHITYPEGPQTKIRTPPAVTATSLFLTTKGRNVLSSCWWDGPIAGTRMQYIICNIDSYITLRCTIPGAYVAYGGNPLYEVSSQVLQFIMDKSFNEHPIFFQFFSNGGALVYQQISVAMQKAESPLKVKGVIFDSCPGDKSVITAYKAARYVCRHHFLSLPMTFMYMLMYSFCQLREAITELIGSNIVSTDSMELTKEPYLWPQMFLYSDVDTFIDSDDMEKFARQRAKRGVRAQLVLFKDSPHLKHILAYRDNYVREIYRFMNECLAEKSDEKPDLVQNKNDLPYLSKKVIIPDHASLNISIESNDIKLNN